MEEVNFTEYKKQLIAAGIPEEDIYDFREDRLQSFYQRYFEWCIDNLNEYSKIFGIEPSYFYYWDTHEINAQAGFISGKYIIRFSKSYMEALYKKLGTKGQFIDKTDWTAYHNLQKVLPNSLEFLMFQASTIFTFYHEFAHLVQFKERAFKKSEYPSNGNFSFENHLYEYDADLSGCQFVSVYFQQFYNELLPKEYRSLNNYKRLMYLGISSIIITQLLFLNRQFLPYPPNTVDISFYTKEKTHPHTFVRIKYIIDSYVRIAKVNGVEIDFSDTANNISKICKEFFKGSELFNDFITGFNENVNEINIYIFELYDAQNANSYCIKHRMEQFGFNIKKTK